jgi:hypothetical protein
MVTSSIRFWFGSNFASTFCPGFQQGGEKQCGKTPGYIGNSTGCHVFPRFAQNQVRILKISKICDIGLSWQDCRKEHNSYHGGTETQRSFFTEIPNEVRDPYKFEVLWPGRFRKNGFLPFDKLRGGISEVVPLCLRGEKSS